MPLPVAHTAIGYTIYELTDTNITESRWKKLFFIAFFSNLPDIDVLPGMVENHIFLYHRMVTHSLLFAITAGLITAAVCLAMKREYLRTSLVASFLVTLHLVADYITSMGIVPFFWPFQHWAEKYSSTPLNWDFLVYMLNGSVRETVTVATVCLGLVALKRAVTRRTQIQIPVRQKKD